MDQIAQAMTTFKIYTKGRLLASRTADDGQLRIEGIASSTIRDHHGDEITEKALRKMAGSALGMTIFLNHEYRVPQDVFGVVERAKVVKSGEIDSRTGQPIYDMRVGIRVAKTNKPAVDTFELIESDAIKLGISIGAMVPEGGATFAKSGGGRYVVDDADLVEASIISLPANSRSWVDHVVKALAGIKPGMPGSVGELILAKRTELLKEMEADEADAADPVQESEGTGEEMVAVELEEGDVGILTTDGEGDSTSEVLKAGTPEAEAWKAANSGPAILKDGTEHEGSDIITDADVQEALTEEGEQPADAQEATESIDEGPEKLDKTRVSVWKDDETIEIDTGRSRPKAAGDLTSQAEPEDEGGPTSPEADVVKSGEDVIATDASPDLMVKALSGQLQATKAENVDLRKERDAALEFARSTIEGTRAIIDRLGELPVGRKTQSGTFADPELRKADETLDRLAGGIYDADVIKMLKK